jgi:hypothetical protein
MYKSVLIPKQLWDRIKDELDGARLCDHDNILPLCDEIEAAEYGAKVREEMIAHVVLDLSNYTK